MTKHPLRLHWVVAAALLLAACATPHFDVDEAIRFQDGTTRFVAFAQKKTGWALNGVQGVEVSFVVDGQEVATGVTDERGFTKAIVDVEHAAPTFDATAEFADQSFRSQGEIVEWRDDRVIVACDIDSTISNTSLNALFFHDLDETSTPIEGSPEVLTEVDEHFQLLYLTARPRFTLAKTRHWLSEHGYPREPVITSLAVSDALGQTKYKTHTLNSLHKHYGNLLIGIGNTDIDADSYGAYDMLVLLVKPKDPPKHEGSVFSFQNWAQIQAFFELNREVLKDPARLRAAIRGEEPLRVPATATQAAAAP